MNDKKIVLVVDDSEIVKKVITKALDEKYYLLEASNGQEAMDIINNVGDIYCVLLDLNMPDYDGFYVLDSMKEKSLLKKIKVFIISGDDTKETIDKAFTYDIIDMINKPFSTSSIESKISQNTGTN